MDNFITQIQEKIRQFDEVSVDVEVLKSLQSEIKEFIAKHPNTGRKLGSYISQLNKAIQSNEKSVTINFQPLSKGALAIGHKPGGKISFKALKQNGATTLLTLLNENEGALAIGEGARKAALNWIWFPFSASRPLEGDDLPKVFKLYAQLKEELETGKHIYIHCSAGIHRTGMIAYGLLRYLGYDEKTAREFLSNLRQVTAEQVGEERLKWGDVFYENKNDENLSATL